MASISSLGVGSGLDLSGLLDQLETAERRQLEPIVAQRQGQQAKISAFGLLESALEQFQDAAAKLDDAGFFATIKSAVSGDTATAVADSDAQPGTYQIDVTQMARGYSVATRGVAERDAALGAGTLTLGLANGDTLEVVIEEGDSSLEAIRDAINAEQGGVAASIVNDGGAEPYRLVLSSRETGTDNAIVSVDFGALDGSLELDAGTEVTARNAQLEVNGIDIESQGNTVEGAIQGVTLELDEIGQVELDLRRDDEAIKTGIGAFVNAYNALQKTIDTLSGYDAESGSAGTLLGNGALRSVESRLRGVMGEAGAGSAFSGLGEIGITLQLDGTLSLDETALDEVLAQSPGDLAELFAGTGEAGGFAGRVDESVAAMIEPRGLIDNATSGLNDSVEGLERRYARMEQSIAATIERYRSQFGQLDGLIANMNSTSAYLTQQFDMLNAQLGRE